MKGEVSQRKDAKGVKVTEQKEAKDGFIPFVGRKTLSQERHETKERGAGDNHRMEFTTDKASVPSEASDRVYQSNTVSLHRRFILSSRAGKLAFLNKPVVTAPAISSHQLSRSLSLEKRKVITLLQNKAHK